MIHSPANLSPKQKSNWRDKLWRMSSSSSGKTNATYSSLQRTPKSSPRVPSLSSSPTSTPGSVKNIKQEMFLTPLDVLDDDHEINDLLDNQIGMVFGDWSIPPPPPRKKSSSNSNKLQLLPAKTISGPKIKPYFTTSFRTECNVNQDICFICSDVLETKLDSEKLVPLECGDCVHGECLQANMEIILEKLSEEGGLTSFNTEEVLESKVLPICRGQCCILEGSSRPISTMSRDIIADFIADAMLSVKLAKMSMKGHEKKSATSASLVFGAEKRVSRYFFKDNQSLRPKSFARRTSHQTQAFCDESCVTEVTVEESETSHLIGGVSTQSLEDIKNIFIKHMLSRYASFNLAILVSLGSLRLVDRLQVAYGDGKFNQLTVYLFSNFIVLETEGPSPTLIPLNGDYIITTPETSVIQFVTTEGQIPCLKLNSEIDAVIEKWGIALTDLSLLLPADVFTSSISVLELMEVERSLSVTSESKEVSSETRNNSFLRSNPRVSTVSIIEPKEIWSRRSNTFERELMKIGVMSFPESIANACDTQPTSPLHIVKHQAKDILSVSLVDHKCSYIGSNCADDSDSDFDSDSDSDLELISEVMHKHRAY